MTKHFFRIMLAGLCTFGLHQTCAAANTKVFASGLQLPSKIIAIGSGNLLVTEVGPEGNSGRISLVDSGGTRHTVIDGLPSGLAAPDYAPDGPNGFALAGRSLYVANGEGDTHVNGPRTGSLLLNPNGPSSPLFSTVLRFRFNDDIASISAPFSLTLALQNQLADGTQVTLDNGIGQTAVVELISAFRVDRPDPGTIYRNTHLYSLAISGDGQTLFADDAGNNAIWKISARAETPHLVTRFPNIPNPLFPPVGPPTSEAVPTSVRTFGEKLLVSLLGGAPFTPGISSIVQVNTRTGVTTPFITGLSAAIDVLPRRSLPANNEFFVLEYSTQFATGAPGRVLSYRNGQLQVVTDGLITPTSLAIDESRGLLFIADHQDGTILSVPLN